MRGRKSEFRNKASLGFHLLLAVILTLAAAAFARADEHTISGTVTNKSGEPLKGAAVQLKNLKTLGVWSRVTDADGKYRFVNIRTPTHYTNYELRAVYKGKASSAKKLVWTKSKEDRQVDFQIDIAGP